MAQYGTFDLDHLQHHHRRTEQKVLISGCFDALDCDDIKLFKEASKLGDLYVCVNKHKQSIDRSQQSLFMVQSIKYVFHAQFSTILSSDLDTVKPDIFYTSERNHSKFKQSTVERRGIKYIIASHSIPDTKYNQLIPWRLCIAGAWLDQAWVSKVIQPLKGSVIVMNINYHKQFRQRSGLANSSRVTAMKLWENAVMPSNLDNVQIAKLLFGAENPPGTEFISGSQDHLGLLLPGINRLEYNGKYWPTNIVSVPTEKMSEICNFVEKVLWIVPLQMRPKGFDPLAIQNLTKNNVQSLANASEKVWNGIVNCDVCMFGEGLTENLKAYKLILPNTVPDELDGVWQKYDKENYGCAFSGAGGGGMLMVIADSKPDGSAYQIEINRESWWRKYRGNYEESKGCSVDEAKGCCDSLCRLI